MTLFKTKKRRLEIRSKKERRKYSKLFLHSSDQLIKRELVFEWDKNDVVNEQ